MAYGIGRVQESHVQDWLNLTADEAEILGRVADGVAYHVIAESMGVSRNALIAWLSDETRRENHARAIIERSHALIDDCLSIDDDKSSDTMDVGTPDAPRIISNPSAVSRDKLDAKIYARHSGYPGGYKEETLGHLMGRRPEEAVRRAVKGMVPHTRLGAQQLRKLKIYAGADHPHQAQRPEPLA